MIDSFEFLNDHWILPVVLAAIFLFLVFLWKEWTQSGRQNFFLKSGLALIALTSLALMALNPAFPNERNGGNFVLLTEGYSEDQLDSIEQENGKIKVLKYSPDQLIPKEIESAKKIFLLGNGIKDYDLWQFEKAPVEFWGEEEINGISRIKFLKEHRVGDSLELEGVYSNAEEGKKLFLQSPGGAALDSVSMSSIKEQKFRLKVDLTVAGKFLYSLVEKDSLGKVLRTEPVPIAVFEKENLKILVLNNFPTFETKYLKNFLAEEGHKLVVKSQITKGRFKYEYFNTQEIPVGNLSEEVLKDFDLFIIDAISLRNLSGLELQALKKSIQNQGLGLFIQADELYFRSDGEFNIFNFSGLPGKDVNPSEFPGINFKRFSYQFENNFLLQPVHRFNNNILSAYRRTGEGRVGTTIFTDTWELILDGKNEVYRDLWTKLVENISKRKNKLVDWQPESKFAFKGEPFDFQVETSIPEPGIQSANGSMIPLMQDVNFPSRWNGRIWAREIGWNSLSLDTLGTFDFYVNDPLDWQTISAANTIKANKEFFSREFNNRNVIQPLKPISPFWFFGLFLICMGGLWLEPKL